MLDYHLHLWPHGQPAEPVTLERLALYCEDAAKRWGTAEIAITEHLFRFSQASRVLDSWWKDEPDPALRDSMARYWASHAGADLDQYVDAILDAQSAGIPVALGLEVDFYPGRMAEVEQLLAGYPFDVLLGSVHWLGTWRFDDLDDPLSAGQWQVKDVDRVWAEYYDLIEELIETGTCDVLAHPDLIKISGKRASAPEEHWDRLIGYLLRSGMSAEVSSAGWRKPVGEMYPAPRLLERLITSGVSLTSASDAHHLGDVAGDPRLPGVLWSAGVRSLQGYRRRKPYPVPVASPVNP